MVPLHRLADRQPRMARLLVELLPGGAETWAAEGVQPGLPAPPADLLLGVGLCTRWGIRGSPPRAQEQQSKGRGAGGIRGWCAILLGGSA